jgi:hypothetical protein
LEILLEYVSDFLPLVALLLRRLNSSTLTHITLFQSRDQLPTAYHTKNSQTAQTENSCILGVSKKLMQGTKHPSPYSAWERLLGRLSELGEETVV